MLNSKLIEEGGSRRTEMPKSIFSHEISDIPKTVSHIFKSVDSEFGSKSDLFDELFKSSRYLYIVFSNTLLFSVISKKFRYIKSSRNYVIGVVLS
jgi:hypothetical protein